MADKLKKVYFLTLVFSFVIPRFGAADVAITDYLSLTIASIIGISTILFFNNNTYFKITDLKIIPLICFFGFFLMALLSSFFAINQTESIITLLKISTVLINIYIIYALEIYKIFSLKNFLVIISIMLFVETIASLYPLYNEILPVQKFEFRNTGFLKGFTGNKNVTSASICLKIPFLLMLLNRSKSVYYKIPLLIVLILSLTNLFFLSSRATFLSLLVIFSFYIFQKILFEFKDLGFLKIFKKYSYLPLVFLVSFYLFDSNSKEDDRSKIQQRVLSINSEDTSSTQRIRYYKQALNYSLNNPLMGVGIGNWKIKSIEIDKENIYSYIIPYNMHNDFLEVLVETNVLGFFFYLLFFLILYWILCKSFFKIKDLNLRDSISLCICALTVYFIDANLNFPLYRPIMQINLLIVLTLSIHLYQKSLVDETV